MKNLKKSLYYFVLLGLFNGCLDKEVNNYSIENDTMKIISVNDKKLELDSTVAQTILATFEKKGIKKEDVWFVAFELKDWVHPDTISTNTEYNSIDISKKQKGVTCYVLTVYQNKSKCNEFIEKYGKIDDSNIVQLTLKSTVKLIIYLSGDLSKILYIDLFPENLIMDSDIIEIVE